MKHSGIEEIGAL